MRFRLRIQDPRGNVEASISYLFHPLLDIPLCHTLPIIWLTNHQCTYIDDSASNAQINSTSFLYTVNPVTLLLSNNKTTDLVGDSL